MTVASRFRFGGSLRGNGGDFSGWSPLAEATHFGEPSSAQLVDATPVARHQCWRIIPTCWDLVGDPVRTNATSVAPVPAPAVLHHFGGVERQLTQGGRTSVRSAQPVEEEPDAARRFRSPFRIMVAWLDDDSLRRVVLERGNTRTSVNVPPFANWQTTCNGS